MAEQPVKFQDMRPGALVVQEPRKVCRTEWTEDGVTLHFEDGTSQTGGFTDALYCVVPDEDGQG